MSAISTEQKDMILKRIESVNTCQKLNQIKQDVDEFNNELIATLLDKLEDLSGLASLLEVPTSPDEVVDWVKSFIEKFLTPALAPALKIQAEYASTLADVTEITNAFVSKAQEIGNCTLGVIE